MRWFTSPHSTACGAVAWENFPPADGTIATVRNGLANLERARSIKRNAAEEQTVERHVRAPAAAHRRAELARAKTDPTFVPTSSIGGVAVRDSPAQAPVDAEPARASAVGTDETPSEVKAPTAAATVAQWVQTWMRMCADSELVSLTDEKRARAVYNLSGRQLRSIRSAALSGSLARRSAELGVDLPDGFTETVADRVDRPAGVVGR